MTENKRFNFNLIFGEDEHKGSIFYNGKIMKTIDVVYLLNKLSNENAELKQELDRIYLRDEKNKKLKEENEWLKKSIKRQQLSNEECSKYIEEVENENMKLKQKIKELEKENGDVE